MKILHTISSLSFSAGGPSQSTTLTLKGLWNNNVNAEILAFDHSVGDQNVLENEKTHFLPFKDGRFKYSQAYKSKLISLMEKNIEVCHIQGIWQYPSYITAKQARKLNKPYIITPRGMLYPQAVASGNKILKKLFLKAHLMNDLQKAACIHATCTEEMQYLRDLGIKSPIAVIPNPVDHEPYINLEIPLKSSFRIGYLGRLHPRKKVEVLIEAWAKIDTHQENDELIIIGDGDQIYVNKLKKLVAEKKLTNVKFTGFLKGKEKDYTIQSLSLLAVPSDFENFGMIIAEALVLGVPVIASKGTPWQELEVYECGFWINNTVDDFFNTFMKAKSISPSELHTMGLRGRELISDHYSIDAIGKKLKKMYEWVLYKNGKLEYIYE